MTRMSLLAIALCGVMAVNGHVVAGEWPGWRGPTGLGYCDEKDLPLEWDAKTGKNILWKTPLLASTRNLDFTSPGWSSPIVCRDRVFVTTALWPEGLSDKERRKIIAEHHVRCFRADDGKPLWDTVIPAGQIVVENIYHGYAVPTPATDGAHVFALFGSGVLVALDFEGKIVWREELPRLRDVHDGLCASPVLHEDTVIIPGIADTGLRALDKKTGKVKWEQKTKVRGHMSTPALIRIGDKLQLIYYAGGVVQGLDPATGDSIWSCRAQVDQASPAYGAGLLFADHGRGGNVGVAIDPTGQGDVTKTHVKWQTKVSGPAGSSAIFVGDRVYRVAAPDFIKCWDAATGNLLFEERAPGITPSASPIATPHGRIYFASSGKSYVIKAGSTFELLATNHLNDGADYATPAVSNGRIYIKGRTNLWCIGKKE